MHPSRTVRTRDARPVRGKGSDAISGDEARGKAERQAKDPQFKAWLVQKLGYGESAF